MELDSSRISVGEGTNSRPIVGFIFVRFFGSLSANQCVRKIKRNK